MWPFEKKEGAGEKEARELRQLLTDMLKEKSIEAEKAKAHADELVRRTMLDAMERDREMSRMREEANQRQLAMQLEMMRERRERETEEALLERRAARGRTPGERSVDVTDARGVADRLERLESALMRIRSIAIGDTPQRLENIARIADEALQQGAPGQDAADARPGRGFRSKERSSEALGRQRPTTAEQFGRTRPSRTMPGTLDWTTGADLCNSRSRTWPGSATGTASA